MQNYVAQLHGSLYMTMVFDLIVGKRAFDYRGLIPWAQN
jgi:hypothetical protein